MTQIYRKCKQSPKSVGYRGANANYIQKMKNGGVIIEHITGNEADYKALPWCSRKR